MSSTARPGADDRAMQALQPVVAVHRNTTSWYNNASFALPLLATLVVTLAGLALRRGDVLAFAAFLGAVTLCMVPVVLVTWRQTPTAVVLSVSAMTSLHRGKVLKSLAWTAVLSVERRETQGNVRWIVSGAGGERIALDGELEELPVLIAEVRSLARLDQQR